jgi:hypothetical protein
VPVQSAAVQFIRIGWAASTKGRYPMEIIKLVYPIKNGETQIAELKMRRPKVRDMVAADTAKSDAAKEMKLFANLCDVTEELIGGLDLEDYRKMQEVYTGFLSSPRPTPVKPA